MNVSKLRNSTDVDRALGVAAAGAEPKKSIKANDGGLEAQRGKAAQGAPPVDLTTDTVSAYLQGISGNSCDGIDALIGGLHGLRERLVSNGGQIKQEIVELIGLNQSVIELTRIVSDGVVHVRAPSVAE
jgi:hypothetical protein